MSLSLWNFTIEDTSPFLTYTPYADGSNSGLTKGWEPWYTVSGFISQNGEGGAGDSYHLTSLEGASVHLQFYGTAVYLYGANATNSSYDVTLDNTAYTPSSLTSDLLFSITNLTEGTHSVILTAKPTSSSQQLAFDRAVISTPLVNNTTPAELFYDNTDISMLKYTGAWSSSTAQGIPNASVTHPWQETFDAGASVAMDIGLGAVGVSFWGMANWGNWLYNVSIDGTENTYNGSTFWKVPDSLLFYQGGLDPTKNHTVSITNTTPKMKLALNSIRVYNIESAKTATAEPASVTSSGITSSATSSSTPTAHSAVHAGVIVGPIIAVAILALLCGFFWWRFRKNRSVPPMASQNMAETDRSPHRPMFPSTGYSDATSTTTLTSPALSPATQVSGRPGATVMTWGQAPYYDEDQNMSKAISSSGMSDYDPSTSSPPSTYAPSSDGTASTRQHRPLPALVGKTRATATPSHPSMDARGVVGEGDVDRLIELIAQRIDRGPRGHDEAAPPEYRG
ncbi:hypothetical protein C8R44DRAFT_262934 [Mycena epipterygia]|nr:hypothetical protein C8R44DRAFT_262934 [Mycena epipterygia]